MMDREMEAVVVEKKKKGTGGSSIWIMMDSTGEVTMIDSDKYSIMHRVRIHTRDFRILDPLLSYPSKILGRETAIVLNLEHIKAIITAKEVLLRDPLEINVIPIVEELRRHLPPANIAHQDQMLDDQHDSEVVREDGRPCMPWNVESPFEFRALEVALEAICSFLDARTRELEAETSPALEELTSKICSRNLDRVRKIKSAMTRLTARVQKVRDELEQLLDDDDDMNDLYLSRKLSDGPGGLTSFHESPTTISRISKASRASTATFRVNENDIEALEMLLEAYYMQIDSTSNKLNTLREFINDTEDYINIQLDNHRNKLIQLELFLSSATICLTLYSLVAGIFGMNLPFSWNEDHAYLFKWVVIITSLLCGIVFILIIVYARCKGLVGS